MSERLILPEDYTTTLDLLQTQLAIKFIKDEFERELAWALGLTRVSAPMFVRPETGLNDDLNGVERAVSFDIPCAECTVQVVHSLAKWKRYALKYYGFAPDTGLYTDMNAIRRDEQLDNLHSVYVDQWDWEKIISAEQRNRALLEDTVKKIVRAIYLTQLRLQAQYPSVKPLLKDDSVFFITSEELLQLYPGLTPHEREDALCREHGTCFIIGIGAKLSDGKPHDGRAPDYDDWSLNGDILVWYPPLGRSVELSSMGIRVDPRSLSEQLSASGHDERRALPFHKALLAGELPLTMGGGIGQSRICMVLLGKAHIGEVQASVWPDEDRMLCAERGIELL